MFEILTLIIFTVNFSILATLFFKLINIEDQILQAKKEPCNHVWEVHYPEMTMENKGKSIHRYKVCKRCGMKTYD